MNEMEQTLSEQAEGPVVCEVCERPLVNARCGCDDEPGIVAKARLIAHPTDRTEYPVHWNDEVAEAFLQLQAQKADEAQRELMVGLEELQQKFQTKLQEVTPILAAMVGDLRNKDFRDSYVNAADSAGTNFGTIMAHEATQFARGLLAQCEVSE